MTADDFTEHQLLMLIESFTASIKETSELVKAFIEYTRAGGRDVETFTLILDRLAREGTKLTMFGRTPLDLEIRDRALAAVVTAAERDPIDVSETRKEIYESLAMSTLTLTWMSGLHHFVEPDDWPDDLARVVLEAVRSAPRITDYDGLDDLNLDHLRAEDRRPPSN